jgi:FdhE protein
VTSRAVLSEPLAAAFTRRAARADHLADRFPAAAGPLRFAAGLYRAQERVAAAVLAAHEREPLRGRLESDLEGFAGALPDLLRYAASGPPGLAAEARARERETPAEAHSRLHGCWVGDHELGSDYLSRALLRPYVEVLAVLEIVPDRPHLARHCPFCGGRPWIAARRTGAEIDGAQRFLGCSLCGREWLFDRIRCPACEEEDPARLPSFRSEQHASVRIEACESCHQYLKSIDLTVDARPIPEVDDLASLAMDLWAGEQGFRRIEPGLAGV